MKKRSNEQRKPKTRKVIKALEKTQNVIDKNNLKQESCDQEKVVFEEFNASPSNFILCDSLYLMSTKSSSSHETRDILSNSSAIPFQETSSITFFSRVTKNDSTIKRSKSIDQFIEGLLILAPDQKEALDELLYSSSSEIDFKRTF
jgi:hypothetical protein